MRINFESTSLFSKNAKRIKKILESLPLKDDEFLKHAGSIPLTKIQNTLAKSYGYNNYAELSSSLTSDLPQLSKLKDDEEEIIENAIMSQFGDLFFSSGMRKDLSYSLSLGLSFFLRSQSKKTKNTLAKDRDYEGYKQLAKEYGMTMPALKKHLQHSGALSVNLPTYKSIIEGKARTRIMFSDYYDPSIKVIWKRSFIKRSLSQKGIKIESPYQQYEMPSGRMKADTNLGYLAGHLVDIIEEVEEINPINQRPWRFYDYDVSMHMLSYMAPRDVDIREHLMSYFDVIIARAKTIKPNEVDKIEKSLGKLIFWIEKH